MEFTVSAMLVTIIVTYLQPFATALVTKFKAKTGVKQFVAVLVAAITGCLVSATQLDGTAIVSQESALLFLTILLGGQASYQGLMKSHNINGKMLPKLGVG